jgi:putative transposase
VINRGNARQAVFHDDGDYGGFLQLLADSLGATPMRLLGFCLMPNHFHLVVWPRADGDLGRWMQWLMTSHVRRHHRRYGSSGHVWQGRFKSFPIQRRQPTAGESARGVLEMANPLWTVLRYVERNPLRAGLVEHAQDWRWSSLRWSAGLEPAPTWVDPSWLERPGRWLATVNRAEDEQELAAVRRSVVRGAPFGPDAWAQRVAKLLGLESSLRPRGRPRKE